MKKITLFRIPLIAIMCFILIIPSIAYADEKQTITNEMTNRPPYDPYDFFPSSEDANLIIKEAVSSINSHSELEDDVLVDKADISNIIKMYIDTDIFQIESNNINDILRELNKGTVIYLVPVYINGGTWRVTVALGSPVRDEIKEDLTTEELKDLEYNVGKWTMQEVAHIENGEQDFFAMMDERTGIKDITPVFVGGIPNIQYPVAIYPDENGEVTKIGFLFPGNSTYDLFAEEDFDPDKDYAVFDYETVKEAYNKLPTPNGNAFGGGAGGDAATRGDDNPFLSILIFAALCIAAVIIIVIRKAIIKKKKLTL